MQIKEKQVEDGKLNQTPNPQSKPSQPSKIIRVKKPRPARTFVFGILAIIVLSGIIWGARAFFLLTNVVSGSSKDGFFSNLSIVSKKDGLKGQSDGRVNVLLIGIGGASHPKGGNLADSIILTNIKADGPKAITMMNLPRDLLVDMPKPLSGQQKINAVHSYGEQEKEKTSGGPESLKKVVETISDQTVNYWIRIDFDGFKKLVDAVGGITIDVPKDISDYNYPADNLIDYDSFIIKAGTRHMDGKTALKYARSRYSTSDFDRSNRQQQIIQAIKDEFEAKGYIYRPDKILEVINIISKHLKTDMTMQEIRQIYDLVKDIPDEKINSVVLDNSATGPFQTYSNGGYYLIPKVSDWSEVKQIAKNIFSYGAILAEKPTVEIQDASGKSICSAEKTELSAIGYTVVSCAKSQDKVSATKIYNFTTEKNQTLDHLKTRYSVTGALIGDKSLLKSAQADFLIIVGTGYEFTHTTGKTGAN